MRSFDADMRKLEQDIIAAETTMKRQHDEYEKEAKQLFRQIETLKTNQEIAEETQQKVCTV